MLSPDWLLDMTLGLLLLTLALAVLRAPSLYAAVVLFIGFGLVLALTWARLGAVDLALAEAAIGAGLTGVLLLGVLAHQPSQATRARAPNLLVWGFTILVFALLVRALLPLPGGPLLLPAQAAEQLPASGVSHPVTAVLLNFRAWDTLLELLVVLFALLGARQLRLPRLAVPAPWPLLLAWSQVLAPLAVVVGGYLLWRGTSAPGGAFQAGAILAGALVLLRLNGLLPALRWQQPVVRVLVLMGVVVFLAVAMATAAWGAGWLHYPPAWATLLIVTIEVAATLSIALTLALLVAGEPEELRS